ncbi:MAG TPA: OmpA family protein [Rhizomicrobium sp.]|nr:OmpA family protein [Rhizomicrobium sp.]
MKTDRIFGAAAVALAAICSSGAGAQAVSGSAPAAGDGVIHLHMPGAQTGGEPIHLHPIQHHAAKPASDAGAAGTLPAAPAEAGSSAAEASKAPAVAAHGKASRETAGKAAIPFNFGDEDAAPPPDGGPAPGAPAPVVPQPSLKTASIPPHAGARIRGSDSEHAGLTRRGAVMFEKGATNPSPAQFNGVKLLAGDLTTALESGASRIQLEAYGGAAGDKSSDARRLSLRRALAVRQLLIDNGVPSNRIDVRAMGGVDDKGPTDRVDVFLRAG